MNLIPAFAALALAVSIPVGGSMLLADDSPAHSTSTAVGVDDPATVINEGATLNTSRVKFDQPTTYSVDDMTLANTYAGAHGLTGCTTPADADLDDIFLAVGVDLQGNSDGLVQEVDLDTALDSAGKRIILLACDAR